MAARRVVPLRAGLLGSPKWRTALDGARALEIPVTHVWSIAETPHRSRLAVW